MPSLDLNNAAVKCPNNEITEDKYLSAILDHCTGLHQGINQVCNEDTTKPGVVDTLLRYSQHFQAYGCNDIRRFKSSMQKIDKGYSRNAFRQALVLDLQSMLCVIEMQIC
ncbi:hypothetical protein BT63DRAFT_454786 [Microthyrium microscopicum]|uniref:Uncharacterized protein n=1 Tax=Microthyrium microscopicum TaxID=703497 RepID=A0A6A6UFM0_9PEZI|nr:hypothetical protein BT63DRAFT_454786 [Microthyrium microscopicum]